VPRWMRTVRVWWQYATTVTISSPRCVSSGNRELALAWPGWRGAGHSGHHKQPDARITPAAYLARGLDFVIVGEVEGTLLSAARAFGR